MQWQMVAAVVVVNEGPLWIGCCRCRWMWMRFVVGRQLWSCEGREGIYNDGDQALIVCLVEVVWHQKLGWRCWGLPTKI